MLAVAMLLGACGTPAVRFDGRAKADGFARRELPGQDFRHIVYFREGDTGAVHLYLDGDGRPYTAPGEIAADPSSREGLILDLMAADPATVMLLGRPCYYLEKPDPACRTEHWTTDRYGEAVLASLEAAARALLAPYAGRPIVLIGYSGGGTLAMLLAPRLPEVAGIITLAANLDTAAWSRYHHYPTLTGSQNPAERPPLSPRLRQWHVFGRDDRNVTREMAARVLVRAPQAVVREVAGQDHGCCWKVVWPELLAEFEAARASPR